MTGRAEKVRSNSRSTAGMSAATVAATTSSSSRESAASMRRSLGPGMSAKSIPANSRIGGRDGGGVGTSVGLATPGGPPMLGGGARALEQGRGADRGGDDEQDAGQEGRDQGLA